MNSSPTSEFYDSRGSDFLKAGENPYLTRHEQLIARATWMFVESQIPRPQGPDASFLDLCCGTGLHSVFPAKLGYQVDGVDISPQSLKAAQWLAEINEVSDRCRFILQDAAAFLRERPERSYDVIFVSGSLYYLNVEEIAPLIKSRLKPGGIFLALETNGDNWMMNVFRRLKNRVYGHRDLQTLHGLLRYRDFLNLKKHFEVAVFSIRYFDFFTLFVALAARSFLPGRLLLPLHRMAALADRIFLNNFLKLRCPAFKVICRGQRLL